MTFPTGNDLGVAVAWNATRALYQALENLPTVPDDESFMVSVVIRFHSDSLPGKTVSGRSKSTIIGQADCLYVPPRPEGHDEN